VVLHSPRKPFAGLALCAAAGILCADFRPVNPFGLAAAMLPCAIFLLLRPRLAGCYAFTVAAFCLFHTINYRENPGRRLAEELGAGPEVVRAAGVVADEPEQRPGARGAIATSFRLRLESIQRGATPRPCNATLLVRWSGPLPSYGDRLSCIGTLSNIPGPRNPAQFDYAAFMKRLNIYSELDVRYASDGTITATGQGNPVMALAFKARHWMQGKLTLDLEDSPEIAGLVQSLILGLKRETPADIKELFRRTGTLHLFTVNGLHIAMLASIAWFLLKPAGINRRRAVFIIIPLLAFYATVTGLSPGSIRATIMATVLLGGELLDRRPLALNSLAAAAFCIFLWDTNELFMPGFQFSFGVVLAIILLAGRFQRLFIGWVTPDPFLPRFLWSRWQKGIFSASRRLAQLLAVSLAASIGSLPFTALYLSLCSPSAILVNVAVVPIAYCILSEGILALLAAPFSNTLVVLFNNSNFALAKGILVLIHLFARIPGGHFYLELPRWSPPLCELTVFDLGGGEAIHLRAQGRDWLIDTGSKFAYGEMVAPYLRSRGINRLDGLVITHGSAKDIGAADEVLEDFAPRQIVESPLEDKSRVRRDFQAALKARGDSPTVSARGDIVRISKDVRMRILYPPPDLIARTTDDKALVFELEAGGSKVLLVSDSGFFTEHWLLDHKQDLKSDILIKGQNATDVSGSLDFIEVAGPKVIICSAGKFPGSAPIPESWAADVTALGIRLFRQDQTGAVHIDLRDGDFAVQSFLGKQTFRARKKASQSPTLP